MKELRIISDGHMWVVEHLVNGRPDEEVMDLFDGEHFIPTPFSLDIPLPEVMAELRRLNPRSRVTVEFIPLPSSHV